jgi:hypothetical protein
MAIPQRSFWWQIIQCALRNGLTGIRQQHHFIKTNLPDTGVDALGPEC